MFSSSSSMCRASDSAFTAALVIEYRPATIGMSAAIDEVLTMYPPSPWLRILGRKAWMPLPTPRMLTSMTQSQSAGVAAATGPVSPIPALLTRTSSRPKRLSTSSAASCIASRSVTSTAMGWASRPSAAKSSTVSSRWRCVRPVTTTVIPARAKARAMPRPIPFDPPVTTATLPCRSANSGLLRRAVGRVAQAEEARGVLLEDQRLDFVLDVELLEILHPPFGSDHREVGTEEHLVLEQRVGVLHELRREVLGRPTRQIDVHPRLVRGHRQRLVLPGEGGVGQDDVHIREVGRHIVDQHGVGVLQPDTTTAGLAGTHAGLAGVEEGDQAVGLDELVQRVGDARSEERRVAKVNIVRRSPQESKDQKT